MFEASKSKKETTIFDFLRIDRKTINAAEDGKKPVEVSDILVTTCDINCRQTDKRTSAKSRQTPNSLIAEGIYPMRLTPQNSSINLKLNRKRASWSKYYI